jgi:hypothetical protein
MNQIRERLQKAIAEQRRPSPEHPPVVGNAQMEDAFLPVSEAAEELRQELSHLPGLSMVVGPHEVRIELHDNSLWFSYAPEKHKFVGSEMTTLWMEGGLREEHFEWETAEACIESLIQACARYVLMAEALGRFQSG